MPPEPTRERNMTAIATKYHGPTDTCGSRISATAEGGLRATISYPHEYDSDGAHNEAALALIDKMGWGGTWVGGGAPDGKGNVYVCVPNGRPVREGAKGRILGHKKR